MPELSLSTCWNSHRHQDGLDILRECADLGFTSVELGHGTRVSLWPGILKGAEQGIVRISSLHNFCPLPVGFLRANPNCYEFSDRNPSLYDKARRLTLETIQWASKLGAKAVVLHIGSTGQRASTAKLESALAAGEFGSRAYIRMKMRSVEDHLRLFEETWPRVRETLLVCAEEAGRLGIRLGLECRERVEEIPLDSLWPRILAEFPEHVGYWHDFGHAARKEALGYLDAAALFHKNAGRLVGCHLHDFIPPDRDHQAPGDGTIPFQAYWPALRTRPLFVLELSPRVPREKVAACLEWWKQNGPA